MEFCEFCWVAHWILQTSNFTLVSHFLSASQNFYQQCQISPLTFPISISLVKCNQMQVRYVYLEIALSSLTMKNASSGSRQLEKSKLDTKWILIQFCRPYKRDMGHEQHWEMTFYRVLFLRLFIIFIFVVDCCFVGLFASLFWIIKHRIRSSLWSNEEVLGESKHSLTRIPVIYGTSELWTIWSDKGFSFRRLLDIDEWSLSEL